MDSNSNNAAINTPVQVTQELIALQSARLQKLGCEQELDKDPIIQSLKDELSLYGDGVAATVDRTNAYYNTVNDDVSLFHSSIQQVSDHAGEIPESLQKIISRMKSS